MQQTPQLGRVSKDQRLGRRDCIHISEKRVISAFVLQSSWCLERAPYQRNQRLEGLCSANPNWS